MRGARRNFCCNSHAILFLLLSILEIQDSDSGSAEIHIPAVAIRLGFGLHRERGRVRELRALELRSEQRRWTLDVVGYGRMWQDGMMMEENLDALSKGFSSIVIGVCACQGCNYSA